MVPGRRELGSLWGLSHFVEAIHTRSHILLGSSAYSYQRVWPRPLFLFQPNVFGNLTLFFRCQFCTYMGFKDLKLLTYGGWWCMCFIIVEYVYQKLREQLLCHRLLIQNIPEILIASFDFQCLLVQCLILDMVLLC